jgi:hypothetical protein
VAEREQSVRVEARHYGRLASFPPYVGGDDDEIDEWQAICACGWFGKKSEYVTAAHLELVAHLNRALAAQVNGSDG